MKDLVTENIEIYKGLQTTFQSMLGGTQNAYLKILHAQDHFFTNHPEFDIPFQEESRALLKSALRKFEYVAMVDEQMHSIREIRSLRANPHLQGCYSIPEESGDEFPFLDELLFDHALFMWRSFLDFYMKYLVYFCANVYVENMSVREFNKNLKKAAEDSKSQKVFSYFQEEVFNEKTKSKNWGNLLRSLRDKTAHNKLLVLANDKIVTRTGQEILEPTINKQPVSLFVQNNFGNNVFYLLVKMTPILYDVEWIPGPYHNGIYSAA